MDFLGQIRSMLLLDPRGVVIDDEHLVVVRAPLVQLHDVLVPKLGQVVKLPGEPDVQAVQPESMQIQLVRRCLPPAATAWPSTTTAAAGVDPAHNRHPS